MTCGAGADPLDLPLRHADRHKLCLVDGPEVEVSFETLRPPGALDLISPVGLDLSRDFVSDLVAAWTD